MGDWILEDGGTTYCYTVHTSQEKHEMSEKTEILQHGSGKSGKREKILKNQE